MDAQRRRGRHAEGVRNDQILLDAAREVFAAHGSAASVAEIAARAGLGIGSLYRRYGSKAELLRHLCILSMQQANAAADDAIAAADPAEALTGYIRRCVALRTGAFAALAGTFETTPDMWALARTGRRLLDRVVQRAHEAGQLRPDVSSVDISWLVEQFARTAPPAGADDADHTVHQRLLAIAIDGLRTGQPHPLPGSPPSTAHYEQRWQATRARLPAGQHSRG